MQKRWATTSEEIGLDKPILQHPPTPGNRCWRIVALEKVAGSSPVGHPPYKHTLWSFNTAVGKRPHTVG
jgi:hypothetical protein